ncbi:ribosome assembly factor SBDS [Candidatus Bathyarchaeota archaeon]|nr:ribosome assembly factor SBDS [Candidatus Bathyarchaeota archaeon]MBS7630663.1 ribosome assembly factor SBDS [Candidatus Bathyarchaeota archaeon]
MSEKYTLVRYSHSGEKFEILVDPDLALAYKRREITDISKTMIVDTIFLDSSKGIKASKEKLEATFGISDPLEVAKIIYDKGQLLLTASQRKMLTEQKLKQIVNIISRTYVDPRTKLPHPPVRIENAIEEAKVSIDPFREAEEQVKEIVKKLMPIIPLSVESLEIAIKIPSEFTAKAYGIVKNMAEIKKQEWHFDGSWIALVSIPAAMQGEFLERLGKATQGNLQTKIMR